LPDEPLCRVWAEAPTMTEAEALAERWAGVVASVVAAED
jgi:phosphomannomutase